MRFHSETRKSAPSVMLRYDRFKTDLNAQAGILMLMNTFLSETR